MPRSRAGGRVKIRILAHLDVRLGPLPLDVFEQPPLPDVTRLHLPLRTAEGREQSLGIAAEPAAEPGDHAPGRRPAVAGHENLVVERHVLPPCARVPLPAAAADELPVDPR